MPKAPDGRVLVRPKDRAAWRKWLAANHATSEPIWLVYRKAAGGKRDLTYDEAVEEALCWGWIDSTVNRHDDAHYRQFFSRRKPTSTWSRSNKDRVARLTADGRMQPAGRALVDVAKANGMWTALDAVENLEVPPDLAKALRATKGAKKEFDAFSASSKKNILWWIASAKRPETRAKRIAETVRQAAEGKRANHPDDRD
jgi:uncharacterized protein YdeI (YjbR/CyaY-like superfamily)